MKLKYYLRGLGMGVLVATIILTIAHHAQNKMSDADIIERAKELGMVMEKDTLFDEPSSKEEQTTTQQATTEQPTTEEPTTEEPTTAPFVSTFSLIQAETLNPAKTGYQELLWDNGRSENRQ